MFTDGDCQYLFRMCFRNIPNRMLETAGVDQTKRTSGLFKRKIIKVMRHQRKQTHHWKPLVSRLRKHKYKYLGTMSLFVQEIKH